MRTYHAIYAAIAIHFLRKIRRKTLGPIPRNPPGFSRKKHVIAYYARPKDFAGDRMPAYLIAEAASDDTSTPTGLFSNLGYWLDRCYLHASIDPHIRETPTSFPVVPISRRDVPVSSKYGADSLMSILDGIFRKHYGNGNYRIC